MKGVVFEVQCGAGVSVWGFCTVRHRLLILKRADIKTVFNWFRNSTFRGCVWICTLLKHSVILKLNQYFFRILCKSGVNERGLLMLQSVRIFYFQKLLQLVYTLNVLRKFYLFLSVQYKKSLFFSDMFLYECTYYHERWYEGLHITQEVGRKFFLEGCRPIWKT